MLYTENTKVFPCNAAAIKILQPSEGSRTDVHAKFAIEKWRTGHMIKAHTDNTRFLQTAQTSTRTSAHIKPGLVGIMVSCGCMDTSSSQWKTQGQLKVHSALIITPPFSLSLCLSLPLSSEKHWITSRQYPPMCHGLLFFLMSGKSGVLLFNSWMHFSAVIWCDTAELQNAFFHWSKHIKRA